MTTVYRIGTNVRAVAACECKKMTLVERDAAGRELVRKLSIEANWRGELVYYWNAGSFVVEWPGLGQTVHPPGDWGDVVEEVKDAPMAATEGMKR